MQDVASNTIEALPDRFEGLPALTNLFVQSNKITKLPASLRALAEKGSRIKRVTLTGNPIPTDTQEYKD